MKKIHKVTLEPAKRFELQIPAGAQIVRVANQHEIFCVWFLLDPSLPKEKRMFRIVPTGADLDDKDCTLEYRGTCEFQGGRLIFHLLEETAARLLQ